MEGGGGDDGTPPASNGGVPEPCAGQRLYRVYGGDSAAKGASWSPNDPRPSLPTMMTLVFHQEAKAGQRTQDVSLSRENSWTQARLSFSG
jgi:hypothetical protein